MKSLFILFQLITFLLFPIFSNAQEKIRFNFVNEDILKIIDLYSKATNTRIIADSTVRGTITALNPNDVTYDQALNQLGDILAINGFSMNKKDDYWIIRNARSAQRDNAEVSTSLPMLHPQRMATWIVTLRYSAAGSLSDSIGRMVNSSYGEWSYNKSTNQIIVSDFTSSLHRFHKMLLEIDKPAETKFSRANEQIQKAEKVKKAIEEKPSETAPAATPPSTDTPADPNAEKVSDVEIKIRKDDSSKEKAKTARP